MFRFSFICGINIITHRKISIINMLRADWLLGIRIKTSVVSVLGIYMNSRYILIT